MKEYCKNCGRKLTFDEIGLHKKLCGKGATSFLCITCLSVHFKVSEAMLYKKIEQLRAMGCGLFIKD